jgi:hypothetical protein
LYRKIKDLENEVGKIKIFEKDFEHGDIKVVITILNNIYKDRKNHEKISKPTTFLIQTHVNSDSSGQKK